MKEIRGIDLDEVKFETLDAVLAFHNHMINNILVTREDITDYHLHRIQKFGIDLEYNLKRWREFMSSPKVHDIKPVQGAKEALEKLQLQGKKLVDITGRLETWKTWTEEALQRHYQTIQSQVIYINAYSNPSSKQVTSKTKSEICKEIGATVMVEDDLHYAEECANNGIKVYLLAKPRNKQYRNGMHPNIIKVDTRKDIVS